MKLSLHPASNVALSALEAETAAHHAREYLLRLIVDVIRLSTVTSGDLWVEFANHSGPELFSDAGMTVFFGLSAYRAARATVKALFPE